MIKAEGDQCYEVNSGVSVSGLSWTVAPPITIWLPPPVALQSPLKLYFSEHSIDSGGLRGRAGCCICSNSFQFRGPGADLFREPRGQESR